MGIVPEPERVKKPSEEPNPPHTTPPRPEPYEQRAGDLSIGSYSAMEYWTKPRRKKKNPIGFAAPRRRKKVR